MDLETVESQLKLLRSVLGKLRWSREERLDILFVYSSIHRDALKCETENTPINAVSRTCSLDRRVKGTVSSLVKEYRGKNCDKNTDEPELKKFCRLD